MRWGTSGHGKPQGRESPEGRAAPVWAQQRTRCAAAALAATRSPQWRQRRASRSARRRKGLSTAPRPGEQPGAPLTVSHGGQRQNAALSYRHEAPSKARPTSGTSQSRLPWDPWLAGRTCSFVLCPRFSSHFCGDLTLHGDPAGCDWQRHNLPAGEPSQVAPPL